MGSPTDSSSFPDRAVAVVGMSGRFPQAPDVGRFWDLLAEGRDGITEAPHDRPWLRELYSPVPRVPARLPTTRGGFLEGVDLFDAGFFEISPREARRIDPQQRLLLEVSFESAEDAGVPVSELSRARTGVFIGAFSGDYWLRQIGDLEGLDLHALQGGTHSALHGRVAYAMNLRGPALTIDTACSSSLVAIHLACQSLRLGECDLAFAGGSHLLLAPYASVPLARSGALGPAGRCAFGDASADGYVQSEAVGMLLLKPLERALADGDRVRAVILGGAVGGSGFTGQGMIAPTVESQEAILRAAYLAAGVDPRDVTFVEAHGTGTPLGDPVELNALARVLGPRGHGRERCLVGSAKTSVGHSEGAAGVVGVIKAVLSLEHRVMTGNPQFRDPHPAVDWDEAPLRLPPQATALPQEGRLFAGVNSFGASGTGAHLVLSTAPASLPAAAPRSGSGSTLLALSARSGPALRDLAQRYAHLITGDGAPALADLCAAAATTRSHHEYRLAVTARTHEGMTDDLRAHLAGEDRPSVSVSDGGCWSAPRIVFVFPGQGSQWVGMGRQLLAHDSAFTRTLMRCDAVIQKHSGWSLRAALMSQDGSQLQRTSTIQPALWAMGVSLAALWRSWGVEPDAVLGHSQGEIAAAQVAGALTLEEAGHISCLRARLIEELALPGALCWVQLPHGQIPGLLADLGADAHIAVEESTTTTVLAGTPQEIERIVTGCERLGISCLPVPVAYAAHSPSVDPVREPLLEQLAHLTPKATRIPFVSSVEACVVPGSRLDSGYWWRNLREPVRFEPAVRTQLTEEGPTVFLQVSPHPVLTGALSREGALAVESLRRDRDETATLHTSLATLYTAGALPDWRAVLGRPARHVELPGYPWQRTHHWHQAPGFPWPPVATAPAEASSMQDTTASRPETAHPVLEAEPTASATGRVWVGRLDRDRHAFLLGHRVSDRPVVPAALYLELALSAAEQAGYGTEVSDVRLLELLLVDDDEPWDLDVRVSERDAGGDRHLEVASRSGASASWTTHATMRVAHVSAAAPARVSLEDLRERCPEWQAGERFYRDRAAAGNEWRGPFRCIAEIQRGRDESMIRIRTAPGDGFRIHPGTLDGCLQAALAAAAPGSAYERGLVLTRVGRIRLHQPPDGGALWVHVRQRPADGDEMDADLTVLTEQGDVIAEITGLRAAPLAPASRERHPAPAREPATVSRLLDLRWRRLPAPAAPTRESGTWLLIHGGTALDHTLQAVLARHGRTVSAVRAGHHYQRQNSGHYRADLSSTDDLLRVLKDAAADSPLAGVVHLGALGCGTASDASTREVQWTATDLCAGLLPLARALSRLQPLSPPKLVIPTRGAQSVIDDDHVPAPWQAPVWGLGQTLRLEVPQCSPVLVDLDAADQPAEADLLGGIVLSALAEDRIALRGGQVYVPRLVDGSPRAAAPDGVALHTSGGIGGIHFKPLARRAAPGRGEIEIEVSHTALNYRDVLRTVGMLAGHDDALVACECAGTVARLGEGVDGLSVGDQVLAFMFSAPGSYTIVPAACAVPRPGRLTPAEAAAVPVAYVSAYHGLIGMARLQPGETVLIHSATGGMGMAAMEIARWRGATVYATAGTETKRDLLLKLGAGKVADSRSPDFARQLRAAGGTDVDVILNTLAGQDAKEANFALLSPFGRYIETARNEMHQGQPLPLDLLLPSRSFHSMDLTALHEHHPVTLGTTLRKVAGLLEQGTLAPPRVEVFPAEQAAEAMGKMMRAEHIGKLALKFPDTGDSRAAQTREVSVRPDATYLVVGGLSGVGGLFTDWLVGQGARHLLLTGRSRITPDASGDSRARRLARLSEDPGLEVQYTAVDVADEQAMSALLHERGQHGHPAVAGVVHSALSLRPAPLVDISETELGETLSPKVAGGWALHRLFRDTDLDFFVLFSSAVSLLSGLRLGSQLGAYAAANAFLDALGAHRRAQGLPATVVNWGYWADTGMAHRLSEHDGRSVRPPGILPISPHEAPELFTALLAADGVLRWMPADWPQYVAAAPADAGSPLLRELLGAHPSAPAGPRSQPPRSRPPASRVPETTGGRSAPAEITTAHDTPHSRQEPPEPPAVSGTADTTVQAPPATPPAAPSAGSSDLETWLVEQLARVLDLAPQDIDATSPVNRLGIDSLLAAELTTRLRREHGHDVTVPRILKAPSLRALARELASQAAAEAPTASPSPRGNRG